MAEPIRNDAEIITGIFGPKPEDPKAAASYLSATGKVAQACKRAREDERRKVSDVVQAAADQVSAKLTEAHGKELMAMALHAKDVEHHITGSAYGRGVRHMVVVLLIAIVGSSWLSYSLATQSQMATVAALNAATRPDATAMRDAMRPQEGGGFR